MNSSSTADETQRTDPAADPVAMGAACAGPRGDPQNNLLRDQNLEAWGAWFLTAARMQAELDTALKRDAGISIVDFNLLVALAEAPEHTLQMSQLAARVAFSAPRLNYRVAQCENAGWMRKTGCVSDKRAHNIVLTEQGLAVYVRAGAIHREQIRRVFDPALRPGDAQVLSRISREVSRLLDAGV